MKRVASVALGLAILAAPVSALPPPLDISVLVLARDGAMPHQIAASQAIVQDMDYYRSSIGGWLRLAPPALTDAELVGCEAADVERESCLRAILAEAPRTGRAVPTVVLVSPGPGETVLWRCVGMGAQPGNPERQAVSLDLDRLGSDRTREERRAEQNKADNCVLSAAAESGW